MNDTELDIPLLTDVIDTKAAAENIRPSHASLPLEQIEESLSQRLIAELSLQLPVLIEAALREH